MGASPNAFSIGELSADKCFEDLTEFSQKLKILSRFHNNYHITATTEETEAFKGPKRTLF